MNTADKLLQIDSGTFEALISAYLRETKFELSQLIQTGLNERGKTIKDPVDAFLKTTINGQLTFVLFEFTTQETKDLEKKWLRDTSSLKRKTKKSIDGDIIKASKKAENLRHNFPNAIFQIVICTNQKVSSSLLEKVYIVCDKLNLKNEGVIEFSQIHSFLENKPYGQWIRQKYLGINANYLSPELFKWIGKKNLENYGEEIFLSSNKNIIKRTVEEELSNQDSLVFLSAGSGYGKSIVCYKLLESQLQKENFILRLNPVIVSQSLTLENAIISQLRTYVPNLFTSHLSNIFEISKGKKIYIVIDDINRVPTPKEILKKIVSWSNKNKKSTIQNTSTPYSIICPIWSKYSQYLATLFQNRENLLFKIIELGRYSEDEAFNYIATYFSSENNAAITPIQIKEFSQNLGFDPFLISRFCEYSTYIGKLQLSNRSQVIEKFIEAKIEERYCDKYLKAEVWKALKYLAFQMLKNKNLQPNFTNLTTWLGENNEELKIIKDLAKDGILIRFSNQDNLLFRHDRIRDIILILKIEELFQDDYWDEDVLLDPYFSELVGQSICRQKQSREKLKLIASETPIALFESLKYLGKCEKYYQDLVVEIINSWIKEFVVSKKISKEIMDDIYWHLSSIDSKYLVQLTEEMPKYSLSINIARFRNGNVLALATYLTGISKSFGDFAFTVGNPHLINITAHSKNHFASKLKKDLNIYLQHENLQEKWREYIIQAAGILEYTEYYNGIFICWKNSKEKVKLLAPSIWALLLCFNENDEKENGHLDNIINYWVKNIKFPVIDDKKAYSYGTDSVARNVKSNCKNFSLAAIKKIESWIGKGFLEECLALDLLTRIDIPWLVEKYFSNPSYWRNVRANNLSEGGLNFPRSKRIFIDIYKNKNLDEDLRKDALRCWITNVDEMDLSEIKELPKYSGYLYSNILFKRLALKDNTVSQEVKPQIKELLKESPYWIGILPKIWGNDVKNELLRHLGSKREMLETLKICSFIPKNEALEILNKCWEIFNEDVDENFNLLNDYIGNYVDNQGLTNNQFSDKHLTFIGSKLITASLINQNNSLLDNVIFLCKKFNNPKPFFQYFPLDYFSTKEPIGWGGYKFHDKKNLDFPDFEILTPFLNYMPYSSLSSIINKASELGFFDWAKENTYHLINHLPAEAEYSQFFLSSDFKSSYDNKPLSSLHFPADIDILDECHYFINKNEKSYLVGSNWLRRLEQRGCSKEHLFDILKNDLEHNPNFRILKFYCDCLVEFGSRSDLRKLKATNFRIDKTETIPLLKTTEYLVKRKRLN